MQGNALDDNAADGDDRRKVLSDVGSQSAREHVLDNQILIAHRGNGVRAVEVKVKETGQLAGDARRHEKNQNELLQIEDRLVIARNRVGRIFSAQEVQCIQRVHC